MPTATGPARPSDARTRAWSLPAVLLLLAACDGGDAAPAAPADAPPAADTPPAEG